MRLITKLGRFSYFVPQMFAALTAAALLLCTANGGEAALTTLVDLPNKSDVFGGIVEGKDGNFYGTAASGTNGLGFIFRVTSAGEYSVIHVFTNQNGGSQPQSALVVAPDGNMYGTTLLGGNQPKVGSVFRITTNGVFNLVHSFVGAQEGQFPVSSLIVGKDGRLYGTAKSGGTGPGSTNGTIVRVNTNGNLAVLVQFNGTNGSQPYGPLVQTADGSLYGTTTMGGTAGLGTVFRVATNGTLTVLHSFSGSESPYPYGGLTVGRDGDLYGTTRGQLLTQPASSSPRGSVFRISPTGTFNEIYTFTGGGDDRFPYGTLLSASDGNLYGTSAGTTNTFGALFSITPTGGLTQLAKFNDANGSSPFGSLIQGSDGNIYGTTAFGGVNGGGTVFRYETNMPPFIIEQPEDIPVTNRRTATFTAKAGGSGDLSYRWLFKGVNVTNSAKISGADSNTLTIDLVEATNAGAYVLRVTNPFGAVNSETGVLKVISVNPDITISKPAQNTRTSNDVIEVTGKASSKMGVSNVFVRANELDWVAAETINSFANWIASVPLEAGTNIIQAYATDDEGRTTTATTRVFRIVTAPLTVNIVGSGTVKPDFNGAALSVGQGYNMTAKPARGFSFAGWTGSATNAKPKLSFIMAPDLSFTASFVDVSRPILKVKSPKRKAKVSDPTLLFSGTTRDNAGVASVQYRLNGGAWTVLDTSNSFTNFSGTATLVPGTNSVSVYAVDVNGLTSKTNVSTLILE